MGAGGGPAVGAGVVSRWTSAFPPEHAATTKARVAAFANNSATRAREPCHDLVGWSRRLDAAIMGALRIESEVFIP